MTTTKNKGGRPRRAPGETLQKVSLNLRPALMFGLELVARDRRTSLSQAAEYALASMLRKYTFEGVEATALELSEWATRTKGETGDTLDVFEHLSPNSKFDLREHPFDRLLWIPTRLHTPEEVYVAAACKNHYHDGEVGHAQYEMALNAYRLGMPLDEAKAQDLRMQATWVQGRTSDRTPKISTHAEGPSSSGRKRHQRVTR